MNRDKTSISISPIACIALALCIILFPIKWVIAWFAAVLIHETGHLLAIKALNISIHSVRFGFSGVIIHTEPMSTAQQLLCTLAGPAFGFLLLFVKRWFPLLAIWGCLQSVYNLLPIENLDGGKILRCILLLFFGEQRVQLICKIVERLTHVMLLIGLIATAKRLSWPALTAAGLIVLLYRCKQKPLANQRPSGYNSFKLKKIQG